MIGWLILGPRIGPKRVFYVVILLTIVGFGYFHVLNISVSQDPGSDLPELNLNQDDGTIELPVNEIDRAAEEKDPKNNNNVFSGDQLRFAQAVEFADMEEFQRYDFSFKDKVVGRASIGSANEVPEIKIDANNQRENATFFSLVRNKDFKGIVEAIMSVEERFNSRFHYDWVFANDEPFHPTFVTTVKKVVSGNAIFVEIPKDFWGYPEWIDLNKATDTRKQMKKNGIKYGDSESYRHMCRFNSGFFYRLPIMQNYRYYWRVEPDIQFNCDLFSTDWFKFMRENGKKYAFTLAPLELHKTVVGLWGAVQNFAKTNSELVALDNNMRFLTEDNGATYNMCHFWSNFEIGDMDFFRLPTYSKFFDHLDREGGFYYSRWGDAPVHTMAVSLLLSKNELFFLEDSGYYHRPNGDCPWDPEIRKSRRCTCFINNDFTWKASSCIPKWFEIHNYEKPKFAPQYTFVNQHHPDPEEEIVEEIDDKE